MAVLSGGDKLESYLLELGKKLSSSKAVDVGFFDGATYPDGTSVPAVAFWNEFGTINAPARPFFRTMIATKSGGWPEMISKALQHSEFNSQKALGLVGLAIEDELRQSITEWQDPPNAPATIKYKGFNKPLTHTGHMKDSVSSEVR